MAGEQTRMLWALVYLLGLIATHYSVGQSTLSMMWATWIWFVLLVVSSWSIGKSYGMKWPAGIQTLWMSIMGTFIVLAVTMLLNLWAGNAAVLFALYLLLNGAGAWATGFEMKNGGWLGMGVMMVVFGLVFPGWFSGVPFLAAALVMGVPMLLSSWKMK